MSCQIGNYLEGHVPPNRKLFGGTVPPNRKLFGGTVPPNSLPLYNTCKLPVATLLSNSSLSLGFGIDFTFARDLSLVFVGWLVLGKGVSIITNVSSITFALV